MVAKEGGGRMAIGARLDLTRAQILAFRRRELDQRRPNGPDSLRLAAWAGLQDSMPRAALLSIHARMEGTEPSTWDDPSLMQVWGPRFHVFVVSARDRAVFTLGTLPDEGPARQRAATVAEALHAYLDGRRLPVGEAGRGLGMHPYYFRYAAATGTVAIRWDGARQPVVWTVPAPDVSPEAAREELWARYLHIYGPTGPEAFSAWAGIGRRAGAAAFAAGMSRLTPVGTPFGDAWILAEDEESVRHPAGEAAPVRLLPSGDPYLLLQGAAREFMVPDARQRHALWTPRVWPGGLLLEGEVAGTWRRAGPTVVASPWRRLGSWQRDAVAAEVAALPLDGLGGRLSIRWEE